MSETGPAADRPDEKDPTRPRSRLFHKYALLFGALVSTVLIASALVEIYFSY